MGNFKFKIFSLLEQLPEKIVTSTCAALDQPVIEDSEHIKTSKGGVKIEPEIWIGRFHRKAEKK